MADPMNPALTGNVKGAAMDRLRAGLPKTKPAVVDYLFEQHPHLADFYPDRIVPTQAAPPGEATFGTSGKTRTQISNDDMNQIQNRQKTEMTQEGNLRRGKPSGTDPITKVYTEPND